MMSLITNNMINKLNASIGTSSSIDDNGKDAVTAPTAGRKIKNVWRKPKEEARMEEVWREVK